MMMMMVQFPLKIRSPSSYDISDKSNILQWYKLKFIEPVIAELSPKWTVDGSILSRSVRPTGKPDSTFFAKLDITASHPHSSITSSS